MHNSVCVCVCVFFVYVTILCPQLQEEERTNERQEPRLKKKKKKDSPKVEVLFNAKSEYNHTLALTVWEHYVKNVISQAWIVRKYHNSL